MRLNIETGTAFAFVNLNTWAAHRNLSHTLRFNMEN